MRLLEINHNESKITKMHEANYNFDSDQLYDGYELILKNQIDSTDYVKSKDDINKKYVTNGFDYDKVTCNSFVEKYNLDFIPNDSYYYPLDGQLAGYLIQNVNNNLGYKQNNSRLYLKKNINSIEPQYYDVFEKDRTVSDYDKPIGIEPNYRWYGAMSYSSPIHNFMKYEMNMERPFWLQYIQYDSTVKADIQNSTPYNTDESFYIKRITLEDVPNDSISFRKFVSITEESDYVLSVYIKCDSNCYITKPCLIPALSTNDSELISINNEWKRYINIQHLEVGNYYVTFEISNFVTDEVNMKDCIKFAGFLLEKGNKPTEYSYRAISYSENEIENNYHQVLALLYPYNMKAIMFTRYLNSFPCYDTIENITIGYNESGNLIIDGNDTDCNFSSRLDKKETVYIYFGDGFIKYKSYLDNDCIQKIFIYDYNMTDIEYSSGESCQVMLGVSITDSVVTTYDSFYRDVVCTSSDTTIDTNLDKSFNIKIKDDECKIVCPLFTEVL